MSGAKSAEAEEYHCKDFEWETLKEDIENDHSLLYHLQPFDPPLHGTATDHQYSAKAWQKFHVQHSSGKFFKERRYLLKEFSELVSAKEGCKVLEVGCGNGSTALPILRWQTTDCLYLALKRNPYLLYMRRLWKALHEPKEGENCNVIMVGVSGFLDLDTLGQWTSRNFRLLKILLYRSATAMECLKASNLYSVEQRFNPFYCDFAATGFPQWLACDSCRNISGCHQTHSDGLCATEGSTCCVGGVDFVTLIFTLSAVPFERMQSAISECFSVLKPGGLLLFRDYGLYDLSMLRFEPQQRVGFREYMRSDGTRSYFFCLDTLKNLFAHAGFIELEVEYCCIKSVNRQNGKIMRRVWVHGKFQKPR